MKSSVVLIAALLLAACASAPKSPTTIEEVCPDDETCPPASDAEVREFFRRYL